MEKIEEKRRNLLTFFCYNIKNMNKRAFTLIELLVVISIVGTLSSVVVSQFGEVRERARNARMIALDTSVYRSQADHLVGEWRFDTNQVPVLDTSGNGNHGTIRNGLTWSENGGFDGSGAYIWSEVNQAIDVGNHPSLNPDKGTITMWIKPTERVSPSIMGLIRTATNGNTQRGYLLHLGNHVTAGNGLLIARLKDGPSTSIAEEIGIQWGKWNHVAFTYTSTEMVLYIDGIELARRDITSGVGQPATQSTYIGAFGNGNNFAFSGTIDQVRVYSNVLLVEEMQAVYAHEARSLIGDAYALK